MEIFLFLSVFGIFKFLFFQIHNINRHLGYFVDELVPEHITLIFVHFEAKSLFTSQLSD